MDIPRVRGSNRGKYLKAGIAAVAVTLVTPPLLANLRPAPPSVETETVVIDSVRRGDMVLEVRGPGTLVPEGIRWIAALTPARVERIFHQPGDSVRAATVLFELSNPDLQIQALEALEKLTAAEGQLVSLRTALETGLLSQRSLVAQARTVFNEAHRNAIAAETLAVRNLGSAFELARAREQEAEARTRLDLEEQRLDLMARSMQAQLDVQKAQVDRLHAISARREKEVEGLRVRAGVDGVLQELPLQPGQWVTPEAAPAKVVQPSRLKAVLRVPETLAPGIVFGQRARIDTRNGIVPGRVVRLDPASQNGTVAVDVALSGPLPAGARPDLSVDGTIEIERLSDVVHVGRPIHGQANSTIGLFKLVEGGRYAARAQVRVGRSSATAVEIVQGLEPGDRVILSDMSRWDGVDRIRLR